MHSVLCIRESLSLCIKTFYNKLVTVQSRAKFQKAGYENVNTLTIIALWPDVG